MSPSPAAASFMVVTTVWGAWATHELLQLKKREVVTVQLSRIMGDFIEAEARAGRPPEETRLRVQAYLKRAGQLTPELPRVGPLSDYTPAHAALYRRRAS